MQDPPDGRIGHPDMTHHQGRLEAWDNWIQRFNEGGLSSLQKAESVLFYEICTQTESSTIHPLDLTDLIGAFTVLGVGLTLSIIYFVLELLTNWSQGRKLNM
ncbi:hypothetical protein TNCV_64451 [Trichonephila clavipes]|nr:hypothetical protein TNCV_64451 [Trichonephila clavipes]